ncbi:phage head morphogenesis protein [Clostridium lacusfryxellense]|uniref:phage head morphogenesis protein n=1 Tax=Clostridium lacusfryxellense TaxID=205328 RepID=UPI001C0CF0CA|nr:phage head morphogenesis protein [Clostridium lacusfryxellense]MBU3112126.1 phage head morphogenesis protein [Clostridium lacusfryxellense]
MSKKSKLNPKYKTLIEDIARQGYNYSDKEMKVVYKEKKKKLDEIILLLALLFTTDSKEGLLKLTSIYQKRLIKDIDNKLEIIGNELGKHEIKNVTDILTRNYQNTYYRNAFVINSGLKKPLKFNKLNKKVAAKEVNTAIDGKLYSDRILKNKLETINKLKDVIKLAIVGKSYLDVVTNDVTKVMATDSFKTHRLVESEITRIQAQAIVSLGIAMSIEMQEYSAILDKRTCSDCGSFDGNTYTIFDSTRPSIPQHSACRCMWIESITWITPSIMLFADEDFDNWLMDNEIDFDTED